MSISDKCDCKWNTTAKCTDTICCCPKPIGYSGLPTLPPGVDKCSDHNKDCNLQWINKSSIRCDLPNVYNTPYYFKWGTKSKNFGNENKNNCCHGEFLFKNNGNFITKNSRGGTLGDISYPRRQLGRWNQSNTNTKLFPVISVGRRARPINPDYVNVPPEKCSEKRAKYLNTTNPSPLTTVRQSGRLFKNAHPNQSKKQLFSYLARNRAYLKR
jgi:hypothetical protein